MEDYSKPFDILANLPRIRKRKIWEVYIDGKLVQLVGATDNRKATAERYIAGKYPNVQFTLKFLEYRIQSPSVGVDERKVFGIMSEKKERKKMEIGEKLVVLLPWYTQVTDDVEPYVHAVVTGVRPDAVLVEYDTPNGRQDAWVDIKDLDCYYVDDDDD